MTDPIDVQSVSGGFQWTIKSGMDALVDENNKSFTSPPTTIVSGWAPTEQSAHEQAQDQFEELN